MPNATPILDVSFCLINSRDNYFYPEDGEIKFFQYVDMCLLS